MDASNYEKLLEAMPAIAEAVNTFKSETVQQNAFQILIKSWLGNLQAADIERPREPEPGNDCGTSCDKPGNETHKEEKQNGQKLRKKSNPTPPKVLGELDLKPDGKTSLKDFIAEKKPKSNEEHFAVIIYYLQYTLKTQGITRDHVHTCFKDIGAKCPVDIDAALRMAATRKGWIDTSNSTDLKVKVSGENFVEIDLPHKEDK